MSGRIHDQPHFFKYMSHDTALQVINTKSFRWSSPTKFNDPFDHQTGFVLDIEPQHFANLLTVSAERIIFGDVEPLANPPSQLTMVFLSLRSLKDQLPRQEVVENLRQDSLKSAQLMQENIGELNAKLQEHLCHSRVFSVSELHDNVVMWSHYAEEHRGVVFKLLCDDRLDNRLLAAQKVQYTDRFLSFPSAEAYAKHLTGEEPLDLVPLIWQLAFTKHTDWSYEKEWRVHIPWLNQPSTEDYTILNENPEIFEAVYLGCRMLPDDVLLIINAVRQHLPSTRVFQGKRSNRSFTLEFDEL